MRYTFFLILRLACIFIFFSHLMNACALYADQDQMWVEYLLTASISGILYIILTIREQERL